jgi:hypothetical protein
MNQERIEANVADVSDVELRRLAAVLTEMASWDDFPLSEQARLALLDLTAGLESVLRWRSTAAWLLEHQVFDSPEAGEPVRVSYPPGWRTPDDEAVGL